MLDKEDMKKLAVIMFIFVITCGLIYAIYDASKDDYIRVKNQNKTIEINHIEKGKSIGRNAMLLYLSELELKDTLNIDLFRLLQIEDSLQKLDKFK